LLLLVWKKVVSLGKWNKLWKPKKSKESKRT
jgi:hypothetical protein